MISQREAEEQSVRWSPVLPPVRPPVRPTHSKRFAQHSDTPSVRLTSRFDMRCALVPFDFAMIEKRATNSNRPLLIGQHCDVRNEQPVPLTGLFGGSCLYSYLYSAVSR